MTKQLQTVYVPNDEGQYEVEDVLGKRGWICSVDKKYYYLYSPEEHARAEKMREVLTRISSGDLIPGAQYRKMILAALNP